MNQIILILVLSILSTETAKPLESEAKILDYKNNNDGLGNYIFSFQTSNDIAREEKGRLVNVGSPDEHFSVVSFYSYLDDAGDLKTVNYTADKNGYVFQQQIPKVHKAAFATVSSDLIASMLGR